nr:uncharacterized protein LOC113733136 [Coffea arabica]
MLMGHAERLPNLGSSKDLLLADPVSEFDGDEEAAEIPETPTNILCVASFEELATKIVQYEVIIWVLISALLVLAWGVGILMLIYLPYKRYVLKKDIASRKLYVTPNEIVYKVSRPSFIPFWGEISIEKRVPLHLVIDIIIEQGCLQSRYGIHTFRVESVARGRAAPVDELQVQGVYNPGQLRKVIVTQASKTIQEVGRSWKATINNVEGENMFRMESSIDSLAVMKSPSRSSKMVGSPHHTIMEHRGVVPADMLLNKLEEVSKSVNNIEFLMEKSQAS